MRDDIFGKANGEVGANVPVYLAPMANCTLAGSLGSDDDASQYPGGSFNRAAVPASVAMTTLKL